MSQPIDGTSAVPTPLPFPPDRDATPLPSTFSVGINQSTEVVGNGVVAGGNPLRLLRLSERAGAMVARWGTGLPVGPSRGEGLLARRLITAGIGLARPLSSTFTARDVTVVIPVRDRPDQLRRVLVSLQGLDCVVVDDHSDDGAQTEAIAQSAGARCVRLPHNVGPAGARNAGVAIVTTPLVAFVDSDCEVADNWLDPLLGYFDDPLVAMVAPRIVAGADPSSSWLARYDVVRSPLDRGTVGGLVRANSAISYVPTAAVVVRRSVMGDAAFNPALRGGEDVDLVWRVTEAGWDVRYVPESTVHHFGPTTVVSWLDRQRFYGTTAGPLSELHPGALAPAQTSIWTAAFWGLALARRPVLATGTLLVSVATLSRSLDGLVERPLSVAWRIAGLGTLRSLLPTVKGLARAWSPLLVAGLLFRASRRACLIALVAPALSDYQGGSSGLDPVSYTALHVADDLAYGTGVWQGCWRSRTLAPLIPRVVVRSRVWSRTALRSRLARSGTTS